jgi:predicted DNA-binding protein with PD1-like motif
MRAKRLLDDAGEQVFALVFDTGEDPVAEQTEVLALVGDIATEGKSGKKVHAHVVLGRRDGSACGGHLLAARVRPTLEVILTESPGHLHRVHDPRSGLPLIKIRKQQAPRRPPRRR